MEYLSLCALTRRRVVGVQRPFCVLKIRLDNDKINVNSSAMFYAAFQLLKDVRLENRECILFAFGLPVAALLRIFTRLLNTLLLYSHDSETALRALIKDLRTRLQEGVEQQ